MTFRAKVVQAAIEERERVEAELRRQERSRRGLDDRAWCAMADEEERPDQEPDGALTVAFSVDVSALRQAFEALTVTAEEAEAAMHWMAGFGWSLADLTATGDEDVAADQQARVAELFAGHDPPAPTLCGTSGWDDYHTVEGDQGAETLTPPTMFFLAYRRHKWGPSWDPLTIGDTWDDAFKRPTNT